MPKISIFIKFIAAILAIVLSAAGIVFTLKNKIEASAEKIYEKQNMLLALQRRESSISGLRADYEIVKRNLPALKNIFPEEKNLGKLIDALERSAADTGNNQNLNFAPSFQAENLEAAKSINFSATLTGSNVSFAAYFRELKKQPYFIEINNIAISNSAGVLNNNTQLSYTAKVFIKK